MLNNHCTGFIVLLVHTNFHPFLPRSASLKEMARGLGFSYQVLCSFCRTSSLLALACLNHPCAEPQHSELGLQPIRLRSWGVHALGSCSFCPLCLCGWPSSLPWAHAPARNTGPSVLELTVVCFPLSHTCQGQGNPMSGTLVLLT